MAESEYPSILDTEEFLRKIGKTEEFSYHINHWKRKILPFLDPNFKNLHIRCIFKEKFKSTHKNLYFPLEFMKENWISEESWAIFNGKTEEFREPTFSVTEEFEFSAMGWRVSLF